MSQNQTSRPSESTDSATINALSRYGHTQDPRDLEVAIACARLDLSEARQLGNPELQIKRLALALYARYQIHGNPADMGEIEELTIR